MTMSADGNPLAPQNVHHAHTPAKIGTMSSVVPILPDRNGVGSFLSLSTKPVTNYKPDPTSKRSYLQPDPTSKQSYLQPSKPGSMTLLLTILSIPPCTQTSFTNKCRSDGISYSMAESAQSGHDFRTNTYTSRASATRRTPDCYGQHTS